MKVFEALKQRHREFIAKQKMFFVATAPLQADGHVNMSPKGYDSFAILSETRVAYIDLGGSGAETIAHARENGRICLMYCAFDGKPLILRMYGKAVPHPQGSPEFDALRSHFPNIKVPVRAIIDIELTRVQDSCGWSVPEYEFVRERDKLRAHNEQSTQEEFMAKRIVKNAKSIDGLDALLPAE